MENNGDRMLTEKRYEEILNLLEQKNNITVRELTKLLKASESTIRRDLNELHKMGKLVKVFGGAVSIDSKYTTKEKTISIKEEENTDEKLRIAKYASSLIKEDDFIYLDAGTTTSYMIDFIYQENVTFVTNAVSHAKHLAETGKKVILIGGELKSATESIVGNEAYANLQKYNFTIGFFGTNGVSKTAGFTTPDLNEAMIKQCAIQHTQNKFILCDHTKFNCVAPITFCEFKDASVITNTIPYNAYHDCENIILAE